jgi:sterol desaturase/sphingolipid hydroxylase (fatty acid hydroxylase superfamily)
MGARTAMGVVAFVTVSFVHVLGALLTVPAVLGFKFGKIQINKVATFRQVLKSMPLVTVNYVITVVAYGVGGFYMAGENSLYDLRAGIPSRGVLAIQSALSLIAFECLFYHIHRAFHQNKWLYAKVHKLHHTWTAPVALASTYAHPVEHILCNLASLFVGPFLCGAHPAVLMSFALLFGVGVNMHHCGYWTDDLGMHDLHHEAFNVNFGNAHILDILYGTYRSHSRLPLTKVSKA